MKKMMYINLLLITSSTLFTACSSKGIKPKTRAAMFQLQQEQIAQLPIATTYAVGREPRLVNNYTSYDMQQIKVVDIPQRNQYHRPQARIVHRPYINYRNNIYNITHKIERDSKTLLGKKYVWGATGPYNYDCSGFTQKVYRDVGINIPRVSRDQARVGQYVNYNNLRKGDMVFFDTHKKRTGLVSHVGIYLGSGNFIHASSSAKKIVIFNFNEKSFYKKRFLWGRRVIQNNRHMASI